MRKLFACFCAVWFAVVCVAAPAGAVMPDRGEGIPLFSGAPSWVLPPARNGVDLNFATGQYWLKGATGPLTNSHLTNETCFTSTGNLVQVGPNQNCVTNLGVAAYEARTNTIYDSAFVGGSAGSWAPHCGQYTPVNQGALTITPSAPYVLNGMPVIDIVYSGTPSGAGTTTFFCSQQTDASAFAGQTWSASYYVALKSGSLTGTNGWYQPFTVWNAALNQTNIITGNTFNSSAGPTSIMKNYSASATLTNVSAGVATRYLSSGVQFNFTGAPLNFTLTFGYSAQELNPTIPASVASATVAAGGSGGTNGACVLTVQGGSGTAATLNGTIASGALSAIGSVASAGSYAASSGLPASPASVTGCGLTGATVNLTPTNNSAQGFATPPILTTSGAQARAADNITLPVICGGSLYASGIPGMPAANSNLQTIAQINDGTYNNLIQLLIGSGTPFASLAVNGVSIYPAAPGGPWAQNTLGKISAFLSGIAGNVTFNAGTPTSSALTGTIKPTQLIIGASAGGGYESWNGMISRVAVSCGQSLLLSEAPANDNDMFAANDNVPWLKVVGVF